MHRSENFGGAFWHRPPSRYVPAVDVGIVYSISRALSLLFQASFWSSWAQPCSDGRASLPSLRKCWNSVRATSFHGSSATVYFFFFFNVAVFRLMLGLPLYLYWDTRKFRLTIIPVQLDKFSVNVESYFNDIAVKVTVKCWICLIVEITRVEIFNSKPFIAPGKGYWGIMEAFYKRPSGRRDLINTGLLILIAGGKRSSQRCNCA